MSTKDFGPTPYGPKAGFPNPAPPTPETETTPDDDGLSQLRKALDERNRAGGIDPGPKRES
jgi:hypothetical protein